MNYLGNSLKTVEVDVFILAGELDEKYCRIAEDLHRKIQNSKVKIVSDCGHNVHFEKPEEFLKFLNGFLQNITNRKLI
jgi:2-succinyl-6-hydroxy-2,4-cyclohexadiene-1-carboxylate synthase